MHRHRSPLRLLTVLAVAVGLAASLAAGALADPAPPKTLTLTPEGNKMAYATTEVTVQAGRQVTIVFENTATSPAMQHNVVVLNTAEDEAVKRVGQAAISASNYVPDDPAVLAATDIAKPGETTEVTFTAPDTPGEYTYVCTYPGHYVSMQGTMIVEE
ncbi:MAG: plastocyanin/azurin family copper-binding protein [Salinibacter sp.]